MNWKINTAVFYLTQALYVFATISTGQTQPSGTFIKRHFTITFGADPFHPTQQTKLLFVRSNDPNKLKDVSWP
jgi:hypothetical protein